MKKIFSLGLIIALLVVCGCATVHVTKTAKEYFEPTDPDEVEILMTVPNRSFIELATVTNQGWSATTTAKMYDSLREKCAPLGANAVIITSSGMDIEGYFWSKGVAIRYKD